MAAVPRFGQSGGIKKNAIQSPQTMNRVHAPTVNATRNIPITPNAPAKAAKAAKPVTTKAASVAEERPGQTVQSAYYTVASRIASRVAEMAESLSIVENPRPTEKNIASTVDKKRPRKLEMRLDQGGNGAVAFSAQFLDATLQRMLHLQNRMLKSSADLSLKQGVEEKIAKEHAEQCADLSRIIALICAEKARQGA